MREDDFAATQRITDVAAVAGPSSSSSSKRIQEQQSSSSTSTSSGGGNALSKLEPFLLLAKSARGAGAAALVDQVTAAPGVYVFAELLDAKAIAELANAEAPLAQKWQLLNLFAYGNLLDYRKHAASLPAINDAQLTKLKMLTLVDYASRTRSLPYATLAQALEMPSIRALEDLLIEAIYADLLVGRINQRDQVLEVDSVIGRDVSATTASASAKFSVQSMMVTLAGWHARVGDTLANLDYQIELIRKQESANAHAAQQTSERISKALADIAKAASAKESKSHRGTANSANSAFIDLDAECGGSGARFDAGDAMELDDDGSKRSPQKSSTRKRTRP